MSQVFWRLASSKLSNVILYDLTFHFLFFAHQARPIYKQVSQQVGRSVCPSHTFSRVKDCMLSCQNYLSQETHILGTYSKASLIQVQSRPSSVLRALGNYATRARSNSITTLHKRPQFNSVLKVIQGINLLGLEPCLKGIYSDNYLNLINI